MDAKRKNVTEPEAIRRHYRELANQEIADMKRQMKAGTWDQERFNQEASRLLRLGNRP